MHVRDDFTWQGESAATQWVNIGICNSLIVVVGITFGIMDQSPINQNFELNKSRQNLDQV
jgi:hypothetical protein